MLSLMFFEYTKEHSAHSEHRDASSGRLQEVKTMDNHKPSGPKSGHGRLQEVVVF